MALTGAQLAVKVTVRTYWLLHEELSRLVAVSSRHHPAQADQQSTTPPGGARNEVYSSTVKLVHVYVLKKEINKKSTEIIFTNKHILNSHTATGW